MAKNPEDFPPTALTLERAVKRFLQAQDLESTVRLIESSIEEIDNQIGEARSRRSELSSQRSELLRQLRATARDEGSLPLLDLMDKFGPAEVPILTLMQDLHGGQAS